MIALITPTLSSHTISTPHTKGGAQMDPLDYDKTLFYTHRLACDDLIYMMYDTKDDFLSKKIERFLKAFVNENDLQKVEKKRQILIAYLDHAVTASPTEIKLFQ
jgi:hypothetical protein